MPSDRSVTGILPKKPKKQQRPRDVLPVETLLISMGFTSKELKDFKRRAHKAPEVTEKPPRFKYRCGKWIALTPNDDQPWWTFHRVSGNHVEYFVDFPLDVEVERIRAFLLGDYPENEQSKHLSTISLSRQLLDACDALLRKVRYNEDGSLDAEFNSRVLDQPIEELQTATAMYRAALRR